MNTDTHPAISFVLLEIVQILISNYLDFNLYIVFTILPAMILLLPAGMNVFASMAVAFISGLCVDFLADGLLGLNAAALVPVALIRDRLFSLTQEKNFHGRNEEVSYSRKDLHKLAPAMLVALAVFLLIYIAADGAGTRPFWFNLLRLVLSFACSFVLSMLTAWVVLPTSK